ncbi:MAG: hypothetical protein R3F39_04620 [Myxococcota bacterium]
MLDDDTTIIVEDADIEFEYIGGDTDRSAAVASGGDDTSGGADTYPGPTRRGAAAAADAAVDSHDQTLLKRQLSAARTEIQVLLNQLADFGKVRGQALARAYEVEALKARTVNLESESGQLRDDLCAARARMADIEAQARQAREEFQSKEALPRPPAVDESVVAELQAARRALAKACAERDGLAADVGRLQETVNALQARAAEPSAEAAALTLQAEQVRALESAVIEAQADLVASRKRRAELEDRIDELQLEVAAAQSRAESEVLAGGEAGALEARLRELSAAVDDLTERLSASEAAREEASERAERTRVALERLRSAYARVQEGEQQAETVAAELEGIRGSYEVAQQRIQALEREVAAERARADAVAAGHGDIEFAGGRAALEAERDELESRLARLEDELVRERKVSDELGARAEAAEAQARIQSASGELGGGGPKSKEFDAELQRLRSMVHSSSTLIQRYLLELEGAKGAIARNRQEAVRYAQRVSGLHEGIGHLYRYLEDAGPPAEQALVLLQEVKRCAGELRALAESNDRFGKAMERAMERLGQVLKDSPITR